MATSGMSSWVAGALYDSWLTGGQQYGLDQNMWCWCHTRLMQPQALCLSDSIPKAASPFHTSLCATLATLDCVNAA